VIIEGHQDFLKDWIGVIIEGHQDFLKDWIGVIIGVIMENLKH